eukprot:TRINITY_DN3349_c0_g2_i1.p6 TRINITY_DN3349_c0_g2~~TRINITY_DN3349_c0_g2_i1.p6  ORF type:complete len:120 (-),score=2.32 TRINITY_DN3349_c0_g2_i1:354-713(-)
MVNFNGIQLAVEKSLQLNLLFWFLNFCCVYTNSFVKLPGYAKVVRSLVQDLQCHGCYRFVLQAISQILSKAFFKKQQPNFMASLSYVQNESSRTLRQQQQKKFCFQNECWQIFDMLVSL